MKKIVHIKIKGKNPIDTGYYDTNLGRIQYNGFGWRDSQMNKVFPEYHFEEIELPSEEEISKMKVLKDRPTNIDLQRLHGFKSGANFILNHLKSNTNETD